VAVCCAGARWRLRAAISRARMAARAPALTSARAFAFFAASAPALSACLSGAAIDAVTALRAAEASATTGC